MDLTTINDTISTTNNCTLPSKETIEIHGMISWFFETILQPMIGIPGIIANTIAIPILCSQEMSSIFNRLLVLLAIYDNVYIICSLLDVMRRAVHNEVHEYAFVYGLYQLHSFVLCGSIFMTVALALERYRAVWRPVEYHNQCIGVNPWKRAIVSYLLPVVAFSTLFNIPKFFEVEILIELDWEITNKIGYNSTTNETIEEPFLQPKNISLAKPTDFRLNEDYVIWYVNVARLLVQGIIPFVSLSFLNYRIYWVMKRRQNMVNRPLVAPKPNNLPPNNITGGGNNATILTARQKKANEAQQAVVLFVIVLLFFLCHSLRFGLNVHEFFNLNTLKQAIENPTCDSFSYVAFSSVSISNWLMTLNASVNFFIYAFTSSTFREVVKSKYGKCMLIKWCIDKMGSCACVNNSENVTNNPEEENLDMIEIDDKAIPLVNVVNIENQFASENV